MRLEDHRPQTTPPWQPLVDGSLQARAEEAILAVADDLEDPRVAGGDPTLSRGSAGIALFFAYLAEALGEDRYREVAYRHLDEAKKAVSRSRMTPSLFAGFTGVAWTVEHLRTRLPAPGRDPLGTIDDALLRHLGHSPWLRNYDLIQGLVGIGVYGLERLPRPTGEALITRVLDRLEETAELASEGITWISRNDWIQLRWRDPYPERYYNLGVAHGVAGVIGFLGATRAVGIEERRSAELLEGAVHWLLAQKLDDAHAYFPSWRVIGREARPARSAWCYGDPGTAAVLMMTADASKPNWQQEAVQVAERAATRPPNQTGVIDTTLCHGTVGLAHLFNRMHRVTGLTALRDAGTTWIERTLEMRIHRNGVGGFAARLLQEPDKPDWEAAPGVITGAAGTALALVAAVYPIEPTWDRVLLLSRPRNTRSP